ncbi:hypothetical protein D6C76_03560 [Aureobasidium pullulans]|uniref:endo-1,3(4)-beta-glucanase n=1 Tax=Aureobasidium pullulans TaxID=5580 RepID=A0A4T0EWW2_AURPU|nr:hypothetical protein D6D22_01407 [Aureobasidium pullulans]TIA19994.1 hypothetical protein D6C81_04415 [Aureobasidium pullulans]TIA79510.1 hypothetical protein D6C76_03560 [Aureobasidium pullulans]
MPPTASRSRMGVLPLFALFSSALAQSIPGASYFTGGGVPGSGAYQLVDDYQPSVFFSKFNYYNSYDPTYGHVQYVNETVANRNGYTTTDDDSITISVDTTNKWPRGGPGRPAVRLISDNTYTHGLFILDLNHMPFGCGTWPAFWLLGPDWPRNGEIDIIEGVHTSTTNTISMHTDSNCTIAGSGQTGLFTSSNCDHAANDNSGCGSVANNTATPNNYGKALSDNNGGVYITEWTSAYVRVWFFPRNNIPSSVTSGSPNITQFGLPMANFQGSCNIDSHFANHSIIINTDFCGAWAGFTYSNYKECPLTTGLNGYDSCVDYVGNNPQAFLDAYWEINSLKVYQLPVNVDSSTVRTSTAPLTSSSPISASNSIINPGMACIELCDGVDGCSGVSHLGGNGAGTCVLKTGTGDLVYDGHTFAAVAISGRSSGSSTTLSTTSTGSIPSTPPKTATLRPTAQPSTCPEANNAVYVDENVINYNVYCSADTEIGSFNSTDIHGGGFTACFTICDVTPDCVGFTFVGASSGTCYFKNQFGGTLSAPSNFVVAFLAQGQTSGSSSLAPKTSSVVLSSVASVPSPYSSTISISTRSSVLSVGSSLHDECFVISVIVSGNITVFFAVICILFNTGLVFTATGVFDIFVFYLAVVGVSDILDLFISSIISIQLAVDDFFRDSSNRLLCRPTVSFDRRQHLQLRYTNDVFERSRGKFQCWMRKLLHWNDDRQQQWD